MTSKEEAYSALNRKVSVLSQNVATLVGNIEQVVEINTAAVKVSTTLNSMVEHVQKAEVTGQDG